MIVCRKVNGNSGEPDPCGSCVIIARSVLAHVVRGRRFPVSFCSVGTVDRLDVDDHLLVYVGVADDLAELLKVYLPVLVFVGKVNGLVDNLLKLGVLQIRAHHHLEDLKQLAITDVAVVVDVVDSEEEWNILRSGSSFKMESIKHKCLWCT